MLDVSAPLYVRDKHRVNPFRRYDPRWHIIWKEVREAIFPRPQFHTWCVTGVPLYRMELSFIEPDNLCPECYERWAAYHGGAFWRLHVE
jgi:hypothetical protein